MSPVIKLVATNGALALVLTVLVLTTLVLNEQSYMNKIFEQFLEQFFRTNFLEQK
jgi:hypothetical protein